MSSPVSTKNRALIFRYKFKTYTLKFLCLAAVKTFRDNSLLAPAVSVTGETETHSLRNLIDTIQNANTSLLDALTATEIAPSYKRFGNRISHQKGRDPEKTRLSAILDLDPAVQRCCTYVSSIRDNNNTVPKRTVTCTHGALINFLAYAECRSQTTRYLTSSTTSARIRTAKR